MILPHKYLNLEIAPIRVAAIVIRILRVEPVIRLRDLQLRVEDQAGAGARFSLRAALSLLYLIGLVEYDVQTDSVLFTTNVEAPA